MLPAFDPLVRVLPRATGAAVAGDLPPSEGVEHGVEVLGHAASGVHRKGHDPLVDERRILLRLPREARVDGVVGVLMIAVRRAVAFDDVAAGDVEVHAVAALVRVKVREEDVVNFKISRYTYFEQ